MRGCRPFTDDEVQLLLDYFKNSSARFRNRDRAWFATGISTGFRITELLSLRIKDVSTNYKAINIASVPRSATKGKREGRKQTVEYWARNILQIWLDELKEKQISTSWYLFQSSIRDNKALCRQAAYDILIEACSHCKIYGAIGTHSMRKTFTDRHYLYRMKQFQMGLTTEDPRKLAKQDTGHKSDEAFDAYLSFQHLKKEEIFSFET